MLSARGGGAAVAIVGSQPTTTVQIKPTTNNLPIDQRAQLTTYNRSPLARD